MEPYSYRYRNKPRKKAVLLVMLLVIVGLAAFSITQYISIRSLQSNVQTLEKRFEQVEQENQMLWEQYDQVTEENEKLREINEELREENYMLRSTSAFSHGNRNTNKVAITIDDGAGATLVGRALDYLKQHNVRATLFPIGTWLEREPEIWQRAINEGHELGNHTYSHAFLTTISEEQIRKELNGWQEAADSALGYPYRTYFFRPPGMYGFTSNDRNTSRYKEIIAQKGMFTILWDVELVYALRNEVSTPARITEHVLSNARGGSIILLHFNSNDIAALPNILTGLRERGLEPCSLSELLLAGS